METIHKEPSLNLRRNNLEAFSKLIDGAKVISSRHLSAGEIYILLSNYDLETFSKEGLLSETKETLNAKSKNS